MLLIFNYVKKQKYNSTKKYENSTLYNPLNLSTVQGVRTFAHFFIKNIDSLFLQKLYIKKEYTIYVFVIQLIKDCCLPFAASPLIFVCFRTSALFYIKTIRGRGVKRNSGF